jgi:Aminoacyl-tRNA editing domain
VKKGAVNLFSIVNDSGNKVHLILDQKLLNAELVAFHPMQNDATTAISKADMQKVIELSNHNPEILDFSQLTTAAVDGAKKEEAKPAAKKEQPKKEVAKKEDAHQLGIEYTKE